MGNGQVSVDVVRVNVPGSSMVPPRMSRLVTRHAPYTPPPASSSVKRHAVTSDARAVACDLVLQPPRFPQGSSEDALRRIVAFFDRLLRS